MPDQGDAFAALVRQDSRRAAAVQAGPMAANGHFSAMLRVETVTVGGDNPPNLPGETAIGMPAGDGLTPVTDGPDGKGEAGHEPARTWHPGWLERAPATADGLSPGSTADEDAGAGAPRPAGDGKAPVTAATDRENPPARDRVPGADPGTVEAHPASTGDTVTQAAGQDAARAATSTGQTPLPQQQAGIPAGRGDEPLAGRPDRPATAPAVPDPASARTAQAAPRQDADQPPTEASAAAAGMDRAPAMQADLAPVENPGQPAPAAAVPDPASDRTAQAAPRQDADQPSDQPPPQASAASAASAFRASPPLPGGNDARAASSASAAPSLRPAVQTVSGPPDTGRGSAENAGPSMPEAIVPDREAAPVARRDRGPVAASFEGKGRSTSNDKDTPPQVSKPVAGVNAAGPAQSPVSGVAAPVAQGVDVRSLASAIGEAVAVSGATGNARADLPQGAAVSHATPGTMRIQLKPEHLGHVGLTLRMGSEGLVVEIRAENAESQRLLELDADSVNDWLRHQGCTVAELRVTGAHQSQAMPAPGQGGGQERAPAQDFSADSQPEARDGRDGSPARQDGRGTGAGGNSQPHDGQAAGRATPGTIYV